MNGILDHFKSDLGKSQLYGTGLALSQLSAGQPVDIGSAIERSDALRSQADLRGQMQNGDFMDQFSEQERAYLSTLPPSVAQELIGQRIFAQPTPVEYDVLGSGLVVDPATGNVVADHRTPEGPGTVVNVNGDEAGPQMGTIPQGFTVIPDGAQEAGYRMVPIPGGPEDTTTADANRTEGAAVSSANVLSTVGDLRDMIEGREGSTTGLFGSMLRNIPGTQAYDANALTTTIRSNLAFDQLQAMREASPTGGALGAVSAPELALLESNLASLDLAQSPERVMASLDNIEQEYTRLLRKAYATSDSPSGLDEIFGGRPSFITESGAITSDMSDEELQGAASTRLRYNPETGAFE